MLSARASPAIKGLDFSGSARRATDIERIFVEDEKVLIPILFRLGPIGGKRSTTFKVSFPSTIIESVSPSL